MPNQTWTKGAPFRWNANRVVWEFFEEGFGGWTVLGFTPSDKSRPMTFSEGIRYLILHPLVAGHEDETAWLRDRVGDFEVDYVDSKHSVQHVDIGSYE